MNRFTPTRTAATIFVSLLTGCGGGSGTSTPATTPATPVPASTVSIGATVSGLAAGEELILTNNGGALVKAGANGAVALPAVAAGSAYDIAVSTHPTGQYCEVAQGAGTAATAAVNVNITCRTAHVYVVGERSAPSTDGSVLGMQAVYHYTLGRDGNLQLSGKSPTVLPQSLNQDMPYVEPGGRYAYVNDRRHDRLDWYEIDSQGDLAAVPMAGMGESAAVQVATLTIKGEIVAVSPDARFLYTVEPHAGIVERFNLKNGKAAPDAPAYFQIRDSLIEQVSFDPTGRHAYFAENDSVTHLTVGADGTLAPAGTTPTPDGAWFLVLAPGNHAYALDLTHGLIVHYAVGQDGALSKQSATPAVVGRYAASLDLSRNGKFLYLSTQNGIAQFAINADGTLSPLQPAVAEGSADAQKLLLDATGRYAYTALPNGALARYTIGADGRLGNRSLTYLPGNREGTTVQIFYR
jgi:6-phosphogluconolactonase (cycloisomerase 2 family)